MIFFFMGVCADANKFKTEFEKYQKLFNSKQQSATEGEGDQLAENMEKLKVEGEGEADNGEAATKDAETSKDTDSTQEVKSSENTGTEPSDSSATEDTASKDPPV